MNTRYKRFDPVYPQKYSKERDSGETDRFSLITGTNDYLYHNITSTITFEQIRKFMCEDNTGMNYYSQPTAYFEKDAKKKLQMKTVGQQYFTMECSTFEQELENT